MRKRLLFYTYVNEKYYVFGILYPLFVLSTNPDSLVEIGVSNINLFKKQYSHIINFYHNKFGNRILFSEKRFRTKMGFFKKKKNLFPGSIRFISEPKLKADYVYIGDSDILILDNNVLEKHLQNIKQNNLDYSNIVRKGTKKLSGLHFIEYNKMYPIKVKPKEYMDVNDEVLLYNLMNKKGYKLPLNTNYRPLHGLHISYFSRPPFPNKTINDKVVDFPSWFSNINYSTDDKIDMEYIEEYFKLQKTEIFQQFYSVLKETDIDLRKTIQIINAVLFYAKNKKCQF